MKRNKEKREAILSLLTIPGIVICGMSSMNPILLIIGVPLALIGGIFFGKVLRYTFLN